MSYQQLPLPETATEMINFGKENDARLLNAVENGLASGAYERAIDVLMPDDINIDNGFNELAYWFAKTIHPVEKPKAGSPLEEHFAPFMKADFIFPTEGIDIKRTVCLSALGDLMASKGLDKSEGKVYEDIADTVFDADIIHTNLESTMTSGEIKATSFDDMSPKVNMTFEQYRAVIGHKGHNYNVVTVANNHILDCGEEGVATTIEMLKDDGAYVLGVNRTAEEVDKPRITETAGLKIGWVSHTFSVNDRPAPQENPDIINVTPFFAVPSPDISRILRQIKALKEENCDLVIASMHWGMEFELYPRAEQLHWAREMIAAGADAIIGHHPHVPQHYEIVRSEQDPEKCVPVIYSLGNALPIFSGPATVLSLALKLRIVEGTKAGNRVVKIAGMHITPVAAVGESDGTVRILKLTTLMNAEKDSKFADYAGKIYHYADSVVGTGWRIQ